MAWKGLHLSRPARLVKANGQLVVGQDDGDVRLPLEDLAWVILDTPQATMTSSLLAACMEEGVVVVVTDAKHHPCGMVLPFHRHHRQAAVAVLQIEAGAPLKKRLWQRIVRAKIVNQAATLERCGRPGAPALREMSKRVGSGDPANIEAQAARHYWTCLFDGFVRSNAADRRNSMLDYGYAIARAAIARALAAYGLLPAVGLRHASASNAFNLADDVLEPFRPFVDRLVVALLRDGADGAGSELSLQDRQSLADLLVVGACVGEEVMTLLAATELVAASLVVRSSASLLRSCGCRVRLTAMKSEEARFVWLFVFFDLPVGTKVQRRHATRFRNFLKEDGFLMLQWSVYARVCRGEDGATAHRERVRQNLPPQGSVRALQVTDRQYGRMKLLLGEASKSERLAPQQLVLL